jgi:hypothetical protein
MTESFAGSAMILNPRTGESVLVDLASHKLTKKRWRALNDEKSYAEKVEDAKVHILKAIGLERVLTDAPLGRDHGDENGC